MDNKHRYLDKIKHADPLNVFIVLSLCMAFYTGFRMPNLWSVNYYIPSIFEGFYRRSLVGTLLYVFGDFRFNYYFIAMIQVAVLTALLGVLFRYACRAEYKLKLIFVVYLLAPTGGYLFHEIGYIEQLLYLLLFLALYTSNQKLGLGLMVASLFVHEMALFTTIPIYFVCLMLKNVHPRQLLIHAAVVGFSFLVLFVYFQTVPSDTIHQFIGKIAFHTGPAARTDYYYIFNNTFNHLVFDNAFTAPPGVPVLPPHGNYFAYHLGFEVILAGLFGMSIAACFVSNRHAIQWNIGYFIAVWVACVSPLFLAFCGIDTARWVFLSFSSSLVFLCLYQNNLPPIRFATALFILTLFLGYGHLWYFDGCHPRTADIQFHVS